MKEFVIDVMLFSSPCRIDFAMGIVSWGAIVAAFYSTTQFINLYAIY